MKVTEEIWVLRAIRLLVPNKRSWAKALSA